MTMKPRVAIIILIWNGRQDTVECLESLRADTYLEKQLIVVDNGSSDDSVQFIRAKFPEVKVIENHANLGFTGGNNVGIREALVQGAKYVYLLNNDTTVEPEALGALVAAAEAEPRFGLLSPVMHYFDPPREIWFAGSQIKLGSGLAVHDNSRQPTRTEAPYEVPWVSGCAILMPASVARKLEGFDERYYLTFEDVDLSLRVRREGLAVVTVPAARIYHKGGMSGKRISGVGYYYVVRNKLLLVRKHCGMGYLPAAFRIIAIHVWDLARRRRGMKDRLRYIRSTFDAVFDHLLCRYGPYRSSAVKTWI
jgi:GT2 family glycosyltransferase